MMMGFAAMMGACGTLWPGWWRNPPPPDPEPWWRIVEIIVGAIGGVVAWVVFGKMVGPDASLVSASIVSFFGGVFLGGLAAAVGIGAKKAGVTTAS